MKEKLLNEWFKLNVELNDCIEVLNSLKKEREEILKDAEKAITPELLERMAKSQHNLTLVQKESERLKTRSGIIQMELKKLTKK